MKTPTKRNFYHLEAPLEALLVPETLIHARRRHVDSAHAYVAVRSSRYLPRACHPAHHARTKKPGSGTLPGF